MLTVALVFLLGARVDDASRPPSPTKADQATRLVTRALAQCDKKQYEDALLLLDEVLLYQPRDTRALALKAWVLNETRQHEQAVRIARLAVRSDPRNANGWTELGYGLLRRKEYPEATEAFTRALELDPRRAEVYDYLAATYDALQQPERAAQIRSSKSKAIPTSKPAKRD